MAEAAPDSAPIHEEAADVVFGEWIDRVWRF